MAALAPERRAAAEALRATVLANLPAGFDETLDYGMLAYGTAREPGGGGGRLSLLSIADHAPYMALYVNCVEPGGEEALYARWRATGTPLETGSRAIRFRRLDELALGVVAEWIAAQSPDALRAAFARARR
nr:DUF1801 domain-containing protein [Conexibacter arvalis]